MTAKELHDDLDRQMRAIREARMEYVQMVHNGRLDGVDYQSWPQYHLLVEMTSRWYVLREIKEILAHIIDPTLEERDKELTEVTGIKTTICLLKRPERQYS